MNSDIARLQPYPFEKLRDLKAGVQPNPGKSPIVLSIGEPQHAAAPFVSAELLKHLNTLSHYPLTKGSLALRESISQWLLRRFHLGAGSIDPERHVLPVTGTREALFSFAQAVVERSRNPLVLLPNPFYQIYEGAALLAGAEPYYLNTTQASGFVPDFRAVPAAVWSRCQLLYICSPGNPTGAVLRQDALIELLELADRYDFIIASDECYSEIYFDETAPPTGLLQAAHAIGRDNFARCVVFHSLSKRSNVPGLRSGFVAGDATILAAYLKYRTYHGCAMPEFIQATSTKLWADEVHVQTNRVLYQRKFNAVLDILRPVLAVAHPEAGFYLWPETPNSDEDFCRGLFQQQHVTVLPGSYLSRQSDGINPGSQRVRIALVADESQCIDAANRIREYIQSL